MRSEGGQARTGRTLGLPALVVVVALGLAGGAWLAFDSLRPRTASGRGGARPFSVTGVLQGDASDAGYARALAPRPFRFPADHGPHPDFRTEWWYFTGNLAAPSGRAFGFQLTFFRSALAPPGAPLPSGSAWRSRQAWTAHFALGDFARRRFRAYELWGREALGLAGARSDRLEVWLRGWSVAERGAGLPWRLQAASPEGEADPLALDLDLAAATPPVAQGEGGLSRKSAAPGNASYYYSLPRLAVRGRVTSGGERLPVAGLAWMDREWSTSSLAPDQVGWDWFSLQLRDGRELMLYRLRRRDGTIDPASAGTLIERDGSTLPLPAGALSLEVLGHWRSPQSGVVYPARWRIRVPAQRLDLTLEPRLADQELRLSFRYWEGAVAVRDRSGRAAGNGFVELTGYGSALP